MESIKTIFKYAAIGGAVCVAAATGIAYVFGEFAKPDFSAVPLIAITTLGVIVGACVGAMVNDLKNNPPPTP